MFQKTRQFQPFPPPANEGQPRFDFTKLITVVPTHQSGTQHPEVRSYNPYPSQAPETPLSEREKK